MGGCLGQAPDSLSFEGPLECAETPTNTSLVAQVQPLPQKQGAGDIAQLRDTGGCPGSSPQGPP